MQVLTKRRKDVNKRKVLIWLVPVAVLALLALIFIPRLLGEEKPPEPAYWPTTGWRTGTPEEQSLDSAKLAEGLQSIQRQDIKIDSLMIIRNGSVVLDAYFHDPYDGAFPHDMASVTKSVMTTLIGIAVDQGKIQIDQPMVSFFPDRTIANLDDRKKSITVGHLASMTNGFESGCLADDMGTLDRMRSNSDWVQATLDRKMAQKPGKRFCYDSPGMHLLSAILQESTGMTALEFARQNLFEPLGIHEVIWESDPQGYTHGWGDLHLKPEDAAKLGYLWLNNGVWDGKQIVSTAWVEDSVKAHSDAGYDEYGYGWWISDGGYFASGRGGQNIKVVPALNAIVVTTGGGFEYDEIDPYLLAAIVDPSKPLPANPEGVAKLDAALADLEQPLPPLPVGPLPDSAKAFLGKTYVFEPNPAGLETMRLEFNDPAEATMYLKLQGSDVALTIGLDGKYRLSPDGSAQRGYWEDPQTFVAEVFDIGLSTRRLHFQDDRIVLEIPGMHFEGQVEKP
jgi:CubicO group peptidase (beta-lactamase class C family)